MTVHEQLQLLDELDSLRGHIEAFLVAAADISACGECDDPVYWLRHRNGSRVAYDTKLRVHATLCRGNKAS